MVQIAILIGFCITLYMLNLGLWDLWNPDEPRYAQVAREMVTGGNWVLMHANGERYVDKPPLFFWLIAFSSFLWQGLTSFSARFPSALLGMLTVLLTFVLGRRLYSGRTGFLSALVLATSIEFAYLSTRANIDATLTFFTTASLLIFLHWYQHDKMKRSGEKDKRSLSIYGFYAGMALATLTKGPVGFILPLLVSLVYLFLEKDWVALKRMRLLTGMILCFGMILSWYVLAALKGGQSFIDETLLHHTLDRFAKGSSHARPFYYYFVNFPADFMPWVLFLPGAIVFGLSKREEGISKGFLFLLVWFVSIFLFFTFSKGKRELYLLPLYPAAALIVGRYWEEYLSGESLASFQKIWITVPIYALMILLLGMGVVLLAVPAVANVPIGFASPGMLKMVVKAAGVGANYLSYIPPSRVIPFIVLLLGSGFLLAVAQSFRNRCLVFSLIVAAVGIGFFYGTRFIFPLVNPYKSARFLSQEITQTIKSGEKLAMYGDFGSVGTAPYNLYTGIVPILEIEEEAPLIDFLRSNERVFCLFKNREFEMLRRKYPGAPFHLLTKRRVGDREMALVSNR